MEEKSESKEQNMVDQLQTVEGKNHFVKTAFVYITLSHKLHFVSRL